MIDLRERATQLGIPLETLPIRYLGLPLTTKNMTRLDYEPLIDKIRSRFLSWTSKTLSYAGRLQLIKSVITSTSNFWCSAFRLPTGCLQRIEQMCSAFLWSGSPIISSKAKVAWSDPSVPKNEGGLGIRSLRDTSMVFSLKLIWLVLSRKSSLWVSWVTHYLIRDSSYWDISPNTTCGSWMWRKLLKLRDVASTFFKSDIRDGASTHFWTDIWCGSQPLIHASGAAGTIFLGIGRKAKVADAADALGWKLRRCRGRVMQEIIEKINRVPPPRPEAGEDRPLWKQGQDRYEEKFVSKATWDQLRTTHVKVDWFRIVWFPQALPRQAFITWLACRNRLDTGDRMRQWGLIQICPLCGEPNETRDHLFFACLFTFTVWFMLMNRFLESRIKPDWSRTLASLRNNRLNKLDFQLVKMAFQASIYWIWRERNGRRHHHSPNSTVYIARTIHREMQNRLLALQQGSTDQEDNEGLQKWNSKAILP